MAQQTEPSPGRRKVRIAGLIVAGLGALAVISAMGSATTGARLARLPHPGEPLPFAIAHHLPIAIVQATFGALFVIAGLALARGREWGRRAVMALACLFAAVGVGIVAAAARQEAMWGVRVFLGAIAAVYVILAYSAIRWLQSPAMRAGCR